MKEKLFYIAFSIWLTIYVAGTIIAITILTKQNDVLTSRNTYLNERVHYLDSVLDNHVCKKFKK